MSGLWVDHVRFNGGPIMEAGSACHVQVEPIQSKVLLPSLGGAPPKPTGTRCLTQNAAFEPVDGLFECWAPNNPGGILNPVYPWGYVALVCMTWEPVTTSDFTSEIRPEDLLPGGMEARVPGAYLGVQLAPDVNAAKVLAEADGDVFFNGWAYVNDLASPAELAARAALPDEPRDSIPPAGI